MGHQNFEDRPMKKAYEKRCQELSAALETCTALPVREKILTPLWDHSVALIRLGVRELGRTFGFVGKTHRTSYSILL